VNTLAIIEKVKECLLQNEAIKELDLISEPLQKSDLYLKIIVTHEDWCVHKEIADAISNIQWKIFEEKGELPAIEWDVVKD
jgi:hypothetical protein